MTKAKLVEKLRKVAVELKNTGVAMQYYGDMTEYTKHAAELIGAGHMADSWADEIESGD